jgi:hypothetical protein
MKCDNLIADVAVGKKGKLKSKFFKPMLMIEYLVREWSELSDELKKQFESLIPPKGAKRCGGNIIVTVEAVNEPYFGGTSASLEITYKCDKCGCTWYPELPTEFSISKFLTKAFQEMPQKKLIELRKELKEKTDEKEKQAEKMRQEFVTRTENRKKK